VTAYPAWTPASRPGIIPLHPLSFGTILGRSFAALRHNPRVLLGFALCVQTIAYIAVIAAIGGVAWASFSRLATLPENSEEYDAIFAGSIAITAVVSIVLGLAATTLSVIVQGVVVTEVAHAAVAEKQTLGALWRRIKPVLWRLVGYSLLLLAAMVVAIAAVGLALFGLATVAAPAAVVLFILAVLTAIPLVLWLSVKLIAAPSAIILERATIGGAIGRSWRLTRRRFWPILGVLVLLNLIFGGLAQVISVPFSFISTALTTVIAPTGDPNASAIIALIISFLVTEAVVLLIQSVASVVQATASALIYIDGRMRHEGLDLDLLAYVERRDAGSTALPDPYLEHIGREIAPRDVAVGYPYPGAYAPQPGAAQYPYGAGYGQTPAYGQPPAYAQAPPYAQPGAYGQPPAYGQPSAYPQQPVYGQGPGYAQAGHEQAPPYAQQPGAYPQQPVYGWSAAHDQAPTPAQAPADVPPSAQAQTAAAAEPADEPPAAPTAWTAPGTPVDGTDRDSPWA